MPEQVPWIWYDGELIPFHSATTHVLTHSLHYGVSAIEGVRAYDGERFGTAVFRLAEHVRRLVDTAKIYRMELPFSAELLERAVLELLRENALGACYIRPIAFLGAEKRGLSPLGARVHVAIAAWPWERYLERAEHGIRVKTSSFARHHVNALPPRAKLSAAYANSVLAHMEASEDGYDEALLLDTEGFVSEGAGENLFIVKNGHIYEPEVTSALFGITRDSLLTLARERGLEVSARRLTRDDVYLADEAFFCGTAVEIAPIVELDRRPIGAGEVGPITRRLREAYRDAVSGRDPEHEAWLTPVLPAALAASVA